MRASIRNDDREIGTSIIRLDAGLDTGSVVAQKRIAVPQWPPRASELERILTLESAELLIKILPSWMKGEIDAHEQNNDVATYCENFVKEDGLLDLSGDPYQNLLKIRAFDTTVGTYAFFERGGKQIRVGIIDAHLENKKLVVDVVKPEGKREMKYEEFLRSGARPM